MVHHRLNEKDARQLLRALSAQVRPVMKSHGFEVNSFEEVPNQVFLGRNWNSGETVACTYQGNELVHHMNHGPAFQALWSRLRTEVRQLQDRGYYGDGYWSSGTRLADSARVDGEGIEATDIPEYMCGGAHTRTRTTSVRRRRGPTGKRREVVPSLHTGRQTARKKKAGSRVTSKYAFSGEGNTLADGMDDAKGKGKGRQAASKRAREERALAVEKRLQALQAQVRGSQSSTSRASSDQEGDSDDEVEIVGETNDERRERLLSSTQGENLNSLKFGSWTDFDHDFNFSTIPERERDDSCHISVASGSTVTDGSSLLSHEKEAEPGKRGLASLAKSEIDSRKRELLGMAPVKGGGRTLGGSPQIPKSEGLPGAPLRIKPRPSTPLEAEWNCLVCTLKNQPRHLACSACSTVRGESTMTTS
ncbi:hypothetical protein BDQ17DRAFT_1392767 [Cyathus striatus]|nr:hypothetical protein BDQ17DRAFT_1392767 [Cyathus striatus]